MASRDVSIAKNKFSIKCVYHFEGRAHVDNDLQTNTSHKMLSSVDGFPGCAQTAKGTENTT